MKPYYKTTGYDYPEEMQQIMSYLHINGMVCVPGKIIEKLYRQYSEEVHAAGWVPVSAELLESFEDWLEDVEI